VSGSDFTVVEWKFINCIRSKLVNLPESNKDILFKVGRKYYAGYFLADGDDFGFYVIREYKYDLILAEEVEKWMYIK